MRLSTVSRVRQGAVAAVQQLRQRLANLAAVLRRVAMPNTPSTASDLAPGW
jgi:hypothetical protein